MNGHLVVEIIVRPFGYFREPAIKPLQFNLFMNKVYFVIINPIKVLCSSSVSEEKLVY